MNIKSIGYFAIHIASQNTGFAEHYNRKGKEGIHIRTKNYTSQTKKQERNFQSTQSTIIQNKPLQYI